MKIYANKKQENKSQSVANAVAQKQNNGESTFEFIDNRPEAIAQRKLQEMAKGRAEMNRTMQFQAISKQINDRVKDSSKIIQRKIPYDSADLTTMDANGIKYEKRKLLLTVANSKSGPANIFLEQGTGTAGAWHAINRHLTELIRAPYNISSGNDLMTFLDRELSAGNYSIQPSANGFLIKIQIDSDHYINVAIGTNGFIVTVYPQTDGTASTNERKY